MSSLVYREFRGLNKRRQHLLNKNNYAECAVNTQLHDGSLKPYPCPEEVCAHDFVIQDIYDGKECECIGFDSPTYVHQYNHKVYVKEANQVAYASTHEDFCNDISCPVSMPCPTVRPTINAGAAGACSFSPRAYMFTWVRKNGGCEVESPPSPISRELNCGSAANLTNIQQPPADQCITHIRLYRFDAGWSGGNENQVQNNSGAHMVAEVPVGTAAYNDGSGLADARVKGLMTYDMIPMPENPNGLGVSAYSLFSWVGNELFISVDGIPELRYPSGRFCFDCDIITAHYWNNSIYVFTERWVYRVDEGKGRDGTLNYSDPPFRFEKILPIINEHSVSIGAVGLSYVSKSGVVIINGNDQAVVSSSIMHSSTFKSQNLTNARTFIYQQYMFIFSPDWDFTHIFEFEDGQTYNDEEYSNHVIYPYSIQAMYIRNDGCLVFASDMQVLEFIEEPPCFDFCEEEQAKPLCTECCEYDYQIQPSSNNEVTDYVSAYLHIDTTYGDVTFRLWDKECGSYLVFECTFTGCGCHEFKLPAGCLSKQHTVQLTGCATVYELRLSTSNKKMGRNPG